MCLWTVKTKAWMAPPTIPGNHLVKRPRFRVTSTHGFTLIELVVVLVILSILLGVAGFMIRGRLTMAKEATLKQTLMQVRKSLDDYYSDKGKYPKTLKELVTERYLRTMPIDPLTKKADWVVELPPKGEGIADVHSSVQDPGSTGEPYSQW